MKKIILIIYLISLNIILFSQTRNVTITSYSPSIPWIFCDGENITFHFEFTGASSYGVGWWVRDIDNNFIISSGEEAIHVYDNYYEFTLYNVGALIGSVGFLARDWEDYYDDHGLQNNVSIISEPININSGSNAEICNNSYTFNANAVSDAVGTWTIQSQAVTFSDIHDSNATAYNIPSGVNIFTWTVENDCGSDYDNVTITREEEPNISTHPQSQTIDEGGYVSFSVVASDASSYQWKKNGSNISGASSSTYQITSVTESDAGTYACVVSNDCGNVTSNNAVLTVNATSSISSNISDIEIYPNPSNGIINIEANEEILIKIYSLSGIKVYEQTVNQKSRTIDLSNLSNGVYFLNSNYKNTIINKKIIINH